MLIPPEVDYRLHLKSNSTVLSDLSSQPIYSVRWLLYSFICLSTCILPQTLDDVLASVMVEEDGTVFTDDELFLLEELVQNPLDINMVTRQELEALPLLTSLDIALIISRRNHTSRLSSLNELMNPGGFSELATKLLPLITTVTPRNKLSGMLRNRWIVNRKDQRVLTQLSFQQLLLKGGLLWERDPGEPSLSDFFSGYIALNLFPNFTLITGDYRIHAGYGLLLGRSARPIKSVGSITNVARIGSGLRPYRSATEYWGLRGIALQTETGIGNFSIAFSTTPQDAVYDSSGITSTSTTGIHDSPSSLTRKHNVLEQLFAGTWQIKTGERGIIGVATTAQRWTGMGTHQELEPIVTASSIFSRWTVGPALLFGELAGISTSPLAYLAGILLSNKNTRWVGSVRSFPANFQGPRSQPFREWSSSNLNELGLYQAVRIRMGQITISAYGDLYRQHKPNNEGVVPVNGYEASASADFHKGGNLYSCRWKEEQKSNGETTVFKGNHIPTGSQRESWRFKSTLIFSKKTKIQLQVDQSTVRVENISHYGFGLSCKLEQDWNIYKMLLHWTGYVVDDYQARLYVWDINLPGEMRNQMLTGTGQSVGILFKVSTPSRAIISLRIRSTWGFSRYTGQWTPPVVNSGFQMDIAF
ncbi:MAG: hypothetical protein ACE5EE_03505 [Fidelibacterota bacterium]